MADAFDAGLLPFAFCSVASSSSARSPRSGSTISAASPGDLATRATTPAGRVLIIVGNAVGFREFAAFAI